MVSVDPEFGRGSSGWFWLGVAVRQWLAQQRAGQASPLYM